MSEKKEHADLRKIIKEWVDLNMNNFDLTIIEDDPGNTLGTGVPKIGGCIPDLYARSMKHGIEIVGEAKTSNDIFNNHTKFQIKSYIEHLRIHKSKGYLIVAVAFHDKEEMINFIRNIVRAINLNLCFNIFVIDNIFKNITKVWDVR
jgi:hypothetical protein